MNARTTEAVPSPGHQKLVGLLITWMNADGFKIMCANYGGYDACAALERYVPDARGYRKDIGLWCVGESKTDGDIDNEHTKRQFMEFANREMQAGRSEGRPCHFYIAIPQGSEGILEQVLEEIGLHDKSHVRWRAFEI